MDRRALESVTARPSSAGTPAPKPTPSWPDLSKPDTRRLTRASKLALKSAA
jgi:hypothetical protein